MLKSLMGKYKVVILIFLVALSFRLLIFGLLWQGYGPGSFYLDNDGQSLDGNDSQHYVLLAKNMVEQGVYSRFVDEPFQPDSYRTPLLPVYFLPFVYFLGFDYIWLAMLILVIILSALPVVVYYLAKLFLSRRWAVVAGLAVALEPLTAYVTTIAEPDILSVLLLAITLYFFSRYVLEDRLKFLAWSSFFLGILSLAKPVGIYLVIIFLIFIAWKLWREHRSLNNWLTRPAIFIIIFLVIISPWLYRNHEVFGVWDLSSIRAHNFYDYYTAPFALEGEVLPETASDREPTLNIKYQEQYVALAIKRIMASPQEYFVNHITGSVRLLLAGNWQGVYYNGHSDILPFDYNPVSNVDITKTLSEGKVTAVIGLVMSNFGLTARYAFWLLFYLLVLGGWIWAYRRDQKVFALFTLFLFLSAYFILAPGSYVTPKYRLPVLPLWLIMVFYFFQSSKATPSLKEKTIVIATGTYLPEVSGQSTFVHNFKNNLPPDYKLIIVSYGDKNEIRDDHVHIIKRDVFRYLRYYLALRQYSREAKFVYAQDLVSSGLPAALAKRRGGSLVVRIGGDFLWEKMVNAGKTGLPVDQYYDQPKNITERMYLRIYRYVLRRSDRIIFNTAWPQSWYIDFFDIAKDKTTVIENPLILSGYDNESVTVLGDEIIFAGRFIPLKNLKRLIKAFKWLKTDKKLVLIGSGPQKEELIKLSAGDQRIKIEDKMDQESLWRRISKCYLFVLPSISEFHPNMAIEVLNLNRPVVLTQEVGFSADLKKRFILINPLSAQNIKEVLESMLNEENYRRQLAVATTSLVAYDWSQVMARHLSLFENILAEVNVLNIGTDKGLVGGKVIGDVIERHRLYGQFVSHLDVIVYANKKEGLGGLSIAKNVFGYPTNSISKSMFFFDAIKIFRKINQRHPVNIVVCQDPFLPALVGLYLKLVYRVKLQINFHGDFWANPSWVKERPINLLFLLISKITVPYADAVRVMSRGQKEKLMTAGIGENKIRIISTPVNLDKYINQESGIENRESESKKIILHVGRDDKVKDYDTLIKAFKEIKNKLVETVFWQVGASKEIDQAMRANDFNEVDLKGSQSAEKLVNIYQRVSVVVLSSSSESFGKVLIEANACGKPVVATATTGAKEIIEDGKNGYLVPIGNSDALADKVIYLLEHPEKAKEMGEYGRQMVKERYGGNTQKIIDLWHDLKNNKSR